MLPPEDYVRAAAAADAHVQVAVRLVELVPGTARLTGAVVRVFRGPADLQGTLLTLNVASTGGDEANAPPDGIGRMPVEKLQSAKVIEAYLENTASGFELTLDLYTLLEAATETPQLVPVSSPDSTRRIPATAWVLAAVVVAAASALLLAR